MTPSPSILLRNETFLYQMIQSTCNSRNNRFTTKQNKEQQKLSTKLKLLNGDSVDFEFGAFQIQQFCHIQNF